MTDMAEDTRTYVRELLPVDRCDKCGAAAMVAVRLISGELLFCGHHAKAYRTTIKDTSVNIYDPMGVL